MDPSLSFPLTEAYLVFGYISGSLPMLTEPWVSPEEIKFIYILIVNAKILIMLEIKI